MVSDSIPNASSNPRDFAKKKRANRSAKLKQCKLDARREQWLSQVKNKVEGNCGGVACSGPLVHLKSERSRQIAKLEIITRSDEDIYGNGSSSMHHYSDSESSSSFSPTSHSSSVLGSNHFTASSRTSSSSGRSSSSFCSGNISEEDEGDDDCLDDWESMADALAASDNKQQEHNPSSKSHEDSTEPESKVEASGGQRAWGPDDACRPQSLPNLISERHLGLGSVWGCKNVSSIPSSCPICFEELDCTDASFLPCECGFRLCLFCHKRILEEDGRCPGCRKHYEIEPVEGEPMLDGGCLTVRLAPSTMVTRS